MCGETSAAWPAALPPWVLGSQTGRLCPEKQADSVGEAGPHPKATPFCLCNRRPGPPSWNLFRSMPEPTGSSALDTLVLGSEFWCGHGPSSYGRPCCPPLHLKDDFNMLF